MKNVQFSPSAINDLKLFKSGNQKLAFRVFELIGSIQSTPFEGLGKPEPLKGTSRDFGPEESTTSID